MVLAEPKDTHHPVQETSCCCLRCYYIFLWCKGAEDAPMCLELSRAFVDFVGTTLGGFCAGSLHQLMSWTLLSSAVRTSICQSPHK